ncbi:MAG: DUF2971 domain-containing protein [Bacteroidota bacterium]
MIRQVDNILSLQRFTQRIGEKSKYLVQYSGEGLYHYTDLNALISIISEHDLWLTNSIFSNDDNEMKHGYSIALEVIKKREGRRQDLSTKRYYKKVEELLNGPSHGVYICCFCEQGNLLSQWRGYGENGTGVSIGFESSGFTRFTGPDMPADQFGLMRLWQVYYDDDEKREIVEAALDLIPEIHMGDPEQMIAEQAAAAIHFFLPTFKNRDFQEESERRLIFTPSKNCIVPPKYRYRKQMLVPYYSLKSLMTAQNFTVDKLPVDDIIIGPGIRKDINRESIEMLLHHNGYIDVNVTVSDTPYRG